MTNCERLEHKNERQPLLRDPVWHFNHRYGRLSDCSTEEANEVLRLEHARNQRFQWMLFLGVTLISLLILLVTMGVLIKLSETHPPQLRRYNVLRSTPPQVSKILSTISSSNQPSNFSSSPSTSLPNTPDIYVYVNGSSGEKS